MAGALDFLTSAIGMMPQNALTKYALSAAASAAKPSKKKKKTVGNEANKRIRPIGVH